LEDAPGLTKVDFGAIGAFFDLCVGVDPGFDLGAIGACILKMAPRSRCGWILRRAGAWRHRRLGSGHRQCHHWVGLVFPSGAADRERQSLICVTDAIVEFPSTALSRRNVCFAALKREWPLLG
jgi:hypothetical protein